MSLLMSQYDTAAAMERMRQQHAMQMAQFDANNKFGAEQAQRQHELNVLGMKRQDEQEQREATNRRNEGLLKMAGIGGTTIGHNGKPGGFFRKALLS